MPAADTITIDGPLCADFAIAVQCLVPAGALARLYIDIGGDQNLCIAMWGACRQLWVEMMPSVYDWKACDPNNPPAIKVQRSQLTAVHSAIEQLLAFAAVHDMMPVDNPVKVKRLEVVFALLPAKDVLARLYERIGVLVNT